MEAEFGRYWHGDEDEARFLLDRRDPGERRRRLIAGCGTIVWHIALILFAINAPAGLTRAPGPSPMELALRNATPLVEPPPEPGKTELTQRDPQRRSPTSEVDLAALQARQPLIQPAARPAQGGPPPGLPAPAQPKTQPIEAPKLDIPQQTNLAAMGNPALLQRPQLQPPLAPAKSPYEPSGGELRANNGRTPSALRAELQRNSVEDAARAVIRSGAGGKGLTVGDAGLGSGGSSNPLLQHGSPGPQQSALELRSDSQGVDFKPYLTQVLYAVRKSWFSVYPESARYGRSGRVTIDFWADHQGQIPHLEIAMPSGTTALDRAAVAGISGAVPLPPLPAGFKGSQIWLRLVFSYNMPR
jgi:TonB family protein